LWGRKSEKRLFIEDSVEEFKRDREEIARTIGEKKGPPPTRSIKGGRGLAAGEERGEVDAKSENTGGGGGGGGFFWEGFGTRRERKQPKISPKDLGGKIKNF